MEITKTKKCSRCGKRKLREHFFRCGRGNDAPRPSCKECERLRAQTALTPERRKHESMRIREWGHRTGRHLDYRRGEEASRAKLTEKNVFEVVRLYYEDKRSFQYIANIFNVHKDTPRFIIARRSWKHLNDEIQTLIDSIAEKKTRK